jgi:hypothetical protein
VIIRSVIDWHHTWLLTRVHSITDLFAGNVDDWTIFDVLVASPRKVTTPTGGFPGLGMINGELTRYPADPVFPVAGK